MVTELRRLLEASVQHPPAEPYDTGVIVRRARTRRRRHRLVAAGSALAVVAVAGAGYGVVRELSGGTGTDKVAHTEPVGPVVHPDAVPVVRDEDVRVFASHVNLNVDNPESGNGRAYEQVTSDGRVLVSQATRRDPQEPISEYQRFALQDPVTGGLRWLPAPPGARYADDHAPSGPVVAAVRGDTVVWLDSERAPMPIDVYDLGTRTWSHLTLDVHALVGGSAGQADLEGVTVSGDRLYFVPQKFIDGSGDRRVLWSMPLDGSAPPTEVTEVGAWGIDGTTLVWTDTTNAPASRVTVRDLETGEEHSFDPQSGDRCNQLSLSVARGVIGLGEYCGTKHGIRDDRMHVVTTDGRPLVTIQGDGLEAGAVGRGFVTATTYGDHGTPPGTFVYDLDASRLVRISERAGNVGPNTLAGGRTLTWSVAVSTNDIKLFAGRWKGVR
jgi:hypothetical protein